MGMAETKARSAVTASKMKERILTLFFDKCRVLRTCVVVMAI